MDLIWTGDMHTFRHMGHLFVSSRLVLYADDILLFKKKISNDSDYRCFQDGVNAIHYCVGFRTYILPNAKSCDLPGKIIALPWDSLSLLRPSRLLFGSLDGIALFLLFCDTGVVYLHYTAVPSQTWRAVNCLSHECHQNYTASTECWSITCHGPIHSSSKT